MSRPAYLVDGQTEQKVIQKLCPKQPVKLIGCNGENVCLKEIAKRISTHINLFNNNFYPIVCVIDKEKRSESIAEIETNLLKHLNDLGHNNDKIIIGIADRMIENWILADWGNFKTYYDIKLKCPKKCFDGIGGKGFIRKTVDFYHETTDGVDLFLSANPQELYEKSPSYKAFIDKVMNIDCFYTERIINA
jgi:Domain of unknown function (DUF4276)